MADQDYGDEYLAQAPLTAAQRVAEQERLDAENLKEVAVMKDAVKLEATQSAAARPYVEWQELAEPVEYSWSDSYPAVLASHAKDVLIDAPIAGTAGFVSETAIAATELSRFVLPIDSIYYGVKQQITDRSFSLESFETGVGVADEAARAGTEMLRGAAEALSPEITNPAAQMEASMIQFIEGFIPAARGIRAINTATKLTFGVRTVESTQAAMVASATVFNPDDPNLANMVELSKGEGGFPDISNALTAALATKPGDVPSMNRLRNALAEAVAGPVVDGFMASLRYGKAQLWAKQHAKQAADAAAVPDPIKVEADVDVEEVARVRAETEAELKALGPEGEAIAQELRGEPGFDNLQVDVEGKSTLILARRQAREGAEEGLGADEAGKLELMERGDNLQIINARVEAESLGQGNGIKLYDEAARLADEQGKTLVSDTSVSEDAARVWESMARRGDDIIDQRITDPDNIEIVKGQIQTRNNTPVFVREAGTAPPRPTLKPLADTGPERLAARPDEAPAIERPKLTQDSIREDFQNVVTEDLREKLIDMVTKGEYLKDDMGWFNNNKFDLGDIETREDLLNMLGTIENIMEGVARDTGRVKVQTWEQTLELARAVGLNAEQAHQLFADVSSGGGLAARMHAAHQTMLANGKRMRNLMAIANKTGNPEDIVAANRAIELQAAIMMETKGSQSEVARAMNAMRIDRMAAAESFAEVASAAREFGVRSKYIDDLLGDATDLASLNAAVDKATRATIPEMIAEVAVNGLLMNPNTHIVNISSNTAMLTITPWERFTAAAIGKGRTALGLGAQDRHLIRATGRSLAAQVMGMRETFRFTYQALKEGVPVTDIRQRVETAARPKISSRSMGLDSDSALGITVDKVVGPSVRVATRLLSAEDEFFKSILNRGELAALAYESAVKQADDKALAGTARAAFIKKREKFLVENPTVAMQREAIDVARRGTFQETAQTGFGPVMERVINYHPFIKMVIAPFFRTPMNIIRQTFVDRVPGLNLFMKKNRDALAAGGKEGDMVIARSVTGTAAITTGYLLVSQFKGPDGPIEIIGKRPYDSTGRFDKVKDYSFRIFNTWFRYNRFDPVGSWLAFAADSTAILDERYDPADPDADKNITDYMAASIGATMRNVMDKVWLKSISDIVETLGRIDRQSPASAGRAMERLIADQVIKVVPFSSGLRALTKQVDPVQREAWTVADRVMAILPGASDGLAIRRDELGREIPNEQGANFLFNPFAAGPEDMDDLNQELARLDFSWPRMDKALEGGKIPLNTEQYSRYKYIVGQVEPFPGIPNLENSLRALTKSAFYGDQTDSIRIETIQAYRNAYRQIGQQQLMDEYPALRKRSFGILIIESEDAAGRRLQFLRDLLAIAE